MSMLIVYTTCKSPEEAKRIAEAVIKKRLAACANIFPPHRAVYEWDGALQNEAETMMILKTTDEGFEALKAEILRLHSYDTPCILAWAADKAHGPFAAWVQDQVTS